MTKTNERLAAEMRRVRHELSVRRSIALAAGDIATYQSITSAMAALPMPGVPPLTKKSIARYTACKGEM